MPTNKSKENVYKVYIKPRSSSDTLSLSLAMDCKYKIIITEIINIAALSQLFFFIGDYKF